MKGGVVTQLNFDESNDRPAKTTLIYDVFQEKNGSNVLTTSIYVVAQFHDIQVNEKAQVLFKHTIDPSGFQKSYIEESVQLDQNCVVDTIKVRSKFITFGCAETKSINFLDRLSLIQVNQAVTVPENEVFYSVEMAEQNNYSG